MKKPAQTAKSKFLAVIFITVAALTLTKGAWAATGSPQNCDSTNCTIGEFLYNDSYSPITTALCKLTSRDPSGNFFLENITMATASALDGWYSYEFTTPSTEGIYRSQVCCTTGSDYLCLDKSFSVTSSSSLSQDDVASAVWNAARNTYTASGSFGEAIQNIVPASSDIAQATWGYSSRTLSDFGTLASAVWSNSSRSLTTFGTLMADVWGSASRTLTGAGLSSGSLATKSDLDSQTSSLKDEIKNTNTISQNVNNEIGKLEKTTQETRLLIEQIVNKPIIQNYVEEETPPVESKINESKAVANQLFINTQYLKSQTHFLELKLESLSSEEVAEGVAELSQKIGEENDSSGDSVFGQISYLKEAWGWPVAEEMFSQSVKIKQSLPSSNSKIAYKNLKNFSGDVAKLENLIGDISNTVGEETLFGKIKEVKELADVFERQASETDSLLASWDSFDFPEKQKRANQLSEKVSAINKIPKINRILFSLQISKTAPEKELKNKLYSIVGLIEANKQLLARKAGRPLATTWLELGSIVFKSLVSNPSNLISQKVPLKYYLPGEVKETDVIEKSEGLTIEYDTEKDQYYVSGEFTLAAGETKTVFVKVQDIWVISPEELESLRKQASELSRPLEKTAYFAQGVTLKSDVNVSLDKILILQKSNTNPETKIRAYREAQIEMKAIKAKMESLKELVTQAGSVGTFFGFVGGTQTMAVWGLIIILVAGFVFLALYMRTLSSQTVATAVEVKKVDKGEVIKPRRRPGPGIGVRLAIVLIFLGIGLGLGVSAGLFIGKLSLPQREEVKIESKESPKPKEVAQASAEKKLIKIFVPSGFFVNIRNGSSLSSTVLTKVKQTSEFTELGEVNGWVKIGIEIEKNGEVYNEGWVNKEFTKEPNVS